jgi:hypothetical protein
MRRLAVLVSIALLLVGAVASAAEAAHGGTHRRTYCQSCLRDSHGRIKRDRSVVNEFKRETRYPTGRPGYRIDHRIPLACGGADAASNLQWLATEEWAAPS